MMVEGNQNYSEVPKKESPQSDIVYRGNNIITSYLPFESYPSKLPRDEDLPEMTDSELEELMENNPWLE